MIFRMIKPIIYKEWLKTRWYIAGAALVVAAFLFSIFLNLGKTAQIRGAAVLWSVLMFKDSVLFEGLRYVPLALGALLAVVQFIPEVVRGRLKLTLHLPYPQGRMVFLMYLYGIVVLAVFCALITFAVALFSGKYVCCELISRIIRTMLPWFLAGLSSYIWVSAACLEPTWKGRVVILVLLAGLLSVLFLSPVPQAYDSFIWLLLAFVLCGQILIFNSIARFKEGLQD